MKSFIIILIITIVIFFLFKFLNETELIENFYFQTWTPYYIDHYYQPTGSYFFYNDGYMYPLGRG